MTVVELISFYDNRLTALDLGVLLPLANVSSLCTLSFAYNSIRELDAWDGQFFATASQQLTLDFKNNKINVVANTNMSTSKNQLPLISSQEIVCHQDICTLI